MGQPVGPKVRGLAALSFVLFLIACSESEEPAASIDPEPSPEVETATAEPSGRDANATTSPASDIPATPAIEEVPQARQIIPGREANAPVPGEAVERVAAPPVPAVPPRPVNLGIVVVEDANRLETRRGPVVLSGTRAIDRDAVCSLADGRTPLCWIIARTAVRRLIGQRLVECVLTERDNTADDHIAPCTLGSEDLARRILSGGWAFAAPEANNALRDAERLARQNGRGLWGLERQ